MENSEKFNYKYSAKEHDEIQAIRKKYSSDEQAHEDKMERLRYLDKSVSRKAACAALTLGIIGTLILGIGMSLAMTDIGALIGIPNGVNMLAGIPVGIAGIVLVCLAYPVYERTLKKERARIAPEIIKLSDELMK